MDFMSKRLAGDADRIKLAQDRDRWRDLVNKVMSLRFLTPWSFITENVRNSSNDG
jgi:hypothetical protein